MSWAEYFKPNCGCFLNMEYTRILAKEMKDWMEAHKDRSFCIERVVGDSVKLYKVDFWISADLLIPFIGG